MYIIVQVHLLIYLSQKYDFWIKLYISKCTLLGLWLDMSRGKKGNGKQVVESSTDDSIDSVTINDVSKLGCFTFVYMLTENRSLATCACMLY